MSHIYEERLQRDLIQIRSAVAEVSRQVEDALQQSLKTLLHQDKQLANETIIGDLPINRKIRAIDRLCHYFVARHLPSAGHLRFVSSVLRMNIAIERIGDYAVTIAREARMFSAPLSEEMAERIQQMADSASQMLHLAIQAFDEQNIELAQDTMKQAYKIDKKLDGAFDLLVSQGGADRQTMIDRFGTLIVLNRLERVSDQAKNICEEIVFAISGQTKKRKNYHVLFLEEADNCLSQMAVAYATKAYPELGTYKSAGPTPADNVDQACALFLEGKGIYLDQAVPQKLSDQPEDWEANHIIVALQKPVEDFLSSIPFHTVTLYWDLPKLPTMPADWEDVVDTYQAVFQELTARIDKLVETLYGTETE